ncbi:hypothetical protein GCM10022223_64410 [Kineosporia mesophila]|uniref:M23ase beta-sheet core domain-containing protein n=1 Tax=Kineosporia mesophila TaxID=566012 RepID=A0ABP7APJ1_9ACTN|nr:VCBS repeat domain-containing M23 family metallopeptidase [Kineosporia mesophila]MCD5349302.1 VCBS repeat domain-containing M23 family metallopeptidase [Kineosporia mesophila]
MSTRRSRIRTGVTTLTAGLIAAGALVATSVPAQAATPDYQMPFPCGTKWRVNTYDDTHAPAVDIVAEPQDDTEGSRIVAPADGTVVQSKFHDNAGNMVQIDHGGRNFTTYIHMQSRSVSIGDTVKQGETIGRIGHTGPTSNGVPHLHFEQGYDANDDGVFTWGTENAERVAITWNGKTYGPGVGKEWRNLESKNGCGPQRASFSGDAKTDLMVLKTNGDLNARVNNGSYFADQGTYSSGWENYLGHEDMGRISFADWDGDGRKDMFVLKPTGDLDIRTNTGEHFSDQGIKSSGWQSYLGHEGQGRLYFADWNGDGLDDMFVLKTSGELTVRTNTGTYFADQGAVSSGWEAYLGHEGQGRISFADWNGDGRDDMFVLKQNGDLDIRTNTGEHFSDQGIKSSGWENYLGDAGQGRLYFADWDGDGLDDMFVLKTSGELTVRTNTGTYFADQGAISSGWQAYLGHEGQGVLYLA